MAADNPKTSFSDKVSERLGYYVYRIIDPRNGLTFYVGKGKGDRIFEHEKAVKARETQAEKAQAQKAEEKEIKTLTAERLKGIITEPSQEEQKKEKADIKAHVHEEIKEIVTRKNSTLRAILKEGLTPVYVIHRHGMEESAAFEVEAALIDTYSGLTNIQGGHYSWERGPASTQQVISSYDRPAMPDPQDLGYKVLAFNVRHSEDDDGLYNAVRLAWRINKSRAEQADYIFAMVRGVCLGVFVAHEWKEASSANFPSRGKDEPERWGFIGEPANDEIQTLYKDKQLPDDLKRKQGEASPFRYLGAWPHKAKPRKSKSG